MLVKHKVSLPKFLLEDAVGEPLPQGLRRHRQSQCEEHPQDDEDWERAALRLQYWCDTGDWADEPDLVECCADPLTIFDSPSCVLWDHHGTDWDPARREEWRGRMCEFAWAVIPTPLDWPGEGTELDV
ncbi:hypothetical protein [Streptomyces cavernae]|uniref:hypothetical protein n=1 Tax=Streptomyces cavernae TaxID=2259034 RepID=UPI000FEB9E9F|nr:hypothetical protein [Streptomyces cavernae]